MDSSKEVEPTLYYCLAHIGCESYSHIFAENDIDFAAFKSLTKEELSVLLPNKLGPQKKIYQEIKRIQSIDATVHTSKKEIQALNPTATSDETKKKDDKHSDILKYGFTIAAGAAGALAVGTVQKCIIYNITAPLTEKYLGIQQSGGKSIKSEFPPTENNKEADAEIISVNNPDVAKYYGEQITQSQSNMHHNEINTTEGILNSGIETSTGSNFNSEVLHTNSATTGVDSGFFSSIIDGCVNALNSGSGTTGEL